MASDESIPYPIPRWLAKVLPSWDTRVEFRKPDGETFWKSHAGPQTWALYSHHNELLVGGARGGGKSALLIAHFAMGDHTLPDSDPAKYSYLNDPTFRGLILRKEYQNMAEFVGEAKNFFRLFGVKTKDDPVEFHFKSGAVIYTNHLNNEEAFEKYRGWNLTKIGIEELSQIPTQAQYLKLLGSLRARPRYYRGKDLRKLTPQIISTTNPDGPGAAWILDRFVEVYDGKGQLIPWNTPMRDPFSKLTRIFIPMRIKDNPVLANDQIYMGMLKAQDEVTQKQWIEGDWHASSGQFFRDYRPDGPRGQEERDKFPWANHRIDAVPLKPWWYRWGSLDWGYDHPSAAHKGCRNEHDKRIHVYDEMLVRRVGSFELGVLLAKWWLPDLEGLPDHQITIYCDPSIFSKTNDSRTNAEQIEAGIKQVLGPYGALLMRFNEDEKAAMQRDPKQAALMFEHRKRQFEGHLCIALKPANNGRVSADVSGAAYIRSLFRFRPALGDLKPSEAHLSDILRAKGVEAYEAELEKWRSQKPEILPMVQIWRICSALDRCLRVAQHDKEPNQEQIRPMNAVNGEGGDDALDSFRYLGTAYKEIESIMPKGYWVQDRVQQAQDQFTAANGVELTDPTRLMQIQRQQQALYDKQFGSRQIQTATPPRAGSMRHRVQ